MIKKIRLRKELNTQPESTRGASSGFNEPTLSGRILERTILEADILLTLTVSEFTAISLTSVGPPASHLIDAPGEPLQRPPRVFKEAAEVISGGNGSRFQGEQGDSRNRIFSIKEGWIDSKQKWSRIIHCSTFEKEMKMENKGK